MRRATPSDTEQQGLRGEFREAVAVGVVATLLAAALLRFVAPDWLPALAEPRSARVERIVRAELASLGRAQQRYHERSGRYALDLAALPWRSGMNLWVRVRFADSVGVVAEAVAGGRDGLRCRLEMGRVPEGGAVGDSARIACAPRS